MKCCMGRSYTNTIVHIIFHIKSSANPIKEEDLSEVFRYIGGIIRSLSGFAYVVGGRPDHIHILASQPTTMSLSDLLREIKAHTSKWIKGLNPEYKNFSWQEGYGAFSVSESKKQAVIRYINNQKEHHQVYSAHEEFVYFLKKNGLSTDFLNRNE